MKIAFGCDHAGFKFKETIIKHLKNRQYEVFDAGCLSPESCDYPDPAAAAARAVSRGICAKGILLCGTGAGMCMAANKVPGVRAAVCWNEEVAKLIREHNDANVICLPARFIAQETMIKFIDIWLETAFSGEDRHLRRIKKVMNLEKTNS